MGNQKTSLLLQFSANFLVLKSGIVLLHAHSNLFFRNLKGKYNMWAASNDFYGHGPKFDTVAAKIDDESIYIQLRALFSVEIDSKIYDLVYQNTFIFVLFTFFFLDFFCSYFIFLLFIDFYIWLFYTGFFLIMKDLVLSGKNCQKQTKILLILFLLRIS